MGEEGDRRLVRVCLRYQLLLDRKRIASFDMTEGNLWETENNYSIFVYYRPLAGRADELIGISSVNSLTGRKGLSR